MKAHLTRRTIAVAGMGLLLMLAVPSMLPMSAQAGYPTRFSQAQAPSVADPGDWPTLGHDNQRTNFNPAETTISAANVNSLVQLWQQNVGNNGTATSASPSVYNGRVYVASSAASPSNNFFVFDAVTGSQAWAKNIGYRSGCFNVGIGSTPAISGTVIVVGADNVSSNPSYYGLSTADGLVLWSNPMSVGASGFPWESPLLANGRAYLGVASRCDNPSVRGEVRAVDVVTGNNPTSQYFVPAGQAGGGIWNSPALSLDGSIVFVGTGEDYSTTDPSLTRAMISMDANTLQVLGHYQEGQAGADQDFGTSVAVFGDSAGRTLVGANHKNGTFYAFDANNINSGPTWSKATGTSVGMMPAYDPTLGSGGTLFIAGSSGRIYAVDPANGNNRWANPITASGFHGQMAIANGLIFVNVGSSGVKVFSESDGSLLRTITPTNAGSTNSGIVVSHGIIYFLSGSYVNAWGLTPNTTATPATPPSTNTVSPPTNTRTPTASPTNTATPSPVVTCTMEQIVPSPNGSGSTRLNAISAGSGVTMWAAGQAGSITFAEYWSGGQWVVTPQPQPGFNQKIMDLNSGPDMWAVGWYEGSGMGTLTEHWNGSQWAIVSSPNGPGYYSELDAVSGSSNDVWAVGYTLTSGPTTYHTLIEHYNGSAWSVVPSPDVMGNGVLQSVSARSSSDVWAVGYYMNGAARNTLIEHFDGAAWSVVASPAPGLDSSLSGVTALAANDVWAVGYYIPASGSYGTVTLHWNGSSWSLVGSPNPDAQVDQLTSISARSATDIWAAGLQGSGAAQHSLMLHYDGSAWNYMPGPAGEVLPSALNGVAVASTGSAVWAAGYMGAGSSMQALIETYSLDPCPTSSPTPSATRTAGVTATTSVSATATFGSTSTAAASATPLSTASIVAGSATPTPASRTPTSAATAVASNTPVSTSTAPSTSTQVGTTATAAATLPMPSATATVLCALAVWRTVASPNVGNLRDVSMSSAADGWAVGDNAILHWDGAQWSQVISPTQAYLNGVFALSPSDAWAVGYQALDAAVEIAVVEHWDGTQWSLVTVPGLDNFTRNSDLSSVVALSPSDVWAVGEACCMSPGELGGHRIRLHFDGTQWTIMEGDTSRTGNFLTDVAAVSSSEVWAVGEVSTANTSVLAEEWDGMQWNYTPISTTGYYIASYLSGVWAASSSEGWAVGSSTVGQNQQVSLVLRRSVGDWNQVQTPDVGTLYGVSGSAPNDVWAVGEGGTLHWDGANWTQTPRPSANLRSVKDVGPNDVWAVGSDAQGNTAIQHYSAQYFADVPPANPFYPFIQCLSCRGIIGGYPCGGPDEPCDNASTPYFRPNNQISRGQIAKIVSSAAGLSAEPGGQKFQDVVPESPFYVWINRLADLNVMGGYPCGGAGEPCGAGNLPYFRPGSNASRGQLSKIVSNAADFSEGHTEQTYEDVPVSSPFYIWIQRLSSRGVMGGYPCGGAGEPCNPTAPRPYFRSNNDVTRGQASKIVSNTFHPECGIPSTESKVRKLKVGK